MEQVKRFGAGVLASVLAVSMLQTMVFAVDIAPDKQKIAGFAQAGQEIGEVSFTLGQEESELTAQMPQTISVSAEDGSEQQLPVTWMTQADYANSDDFYYAFVPQWDADTYDVAPDAEVPYILAQRTDATVMEQDGVRSMNVEASGANATAIFKFFVNTMNYSSAAACGVLANIKAESDFNPHCYGDNGTSYGICQWHNSRFTALKNWCSQNGYDYTTLNGQLSYLTTHTTRAITGAVTMKCRRTRRAWQRRAAMWQRTRTGRNLARVRTAPPPSARFSRMSAARHGTRIPCSLSMITS